MANRSIGMALRPIQLVDRPIDIIIRPNSHPAQIYPIRSSGRVIISSGRLNRPSDRLTHPSDSQHLETFRDLHFPFGRLTISFDRMSCPSGRFAVPFDRTGDLFDQIQFSVLNAFQPSTNSRVYKIIHYRILPYCESRLNSINFSCLSIIVLLTLRSR